MFSSGQRQMLLAVLLFSIMGIIVKELHYLGAHQLVFFRALVILFLGFMHLRLQKKSLLGNRKKILIWRGVWGTAGLYCFFYTVQVMPLASAVTLQFLSPLFVLLISSLFLKEYATWKHWLWFVGAFVGVGMIKGFDPRVENFALLAGVFGALCSGVSYNLVRVLRNSDDPAVIVFYFALVAGPTMIPFCILNWSPMNLWELSLCFVLGGVTYWAQIALTKAFHRERASRISHFIYLGTVLALLYGFFLFDEVVPVEALFGMALIIFCVLMISRLKEHKVAS